MSNAIRDLLHAKEVFTNSIMNCQNTLWHLKLFFGKKKQMEEIIAKAEKEMEEIKKENPACFLSAKDFFKGSKQKKPSEKTKQEVLTRYTAKENLAKNQKYELDSKMEDIDNLLESTLGNLLGTTLLFQSESFNHIYPIEPNLCRKAMEYYMELVNYMKEVFGKKVSENKEIAISVKMIKPNLKK